MTSIFERLHNGERIDMRSPEYQEVIAELHRADTALFKLNRQLPRTAAQAAAWDDLFAGHAPAGVSFMAPLQIDFPKQVRFCRNVFINHHLTMMSIGGITVGNNVQFGPNVTLATDNHDLQDHNILECQPINIQDNAWIGANATILPGVTVGANAVIAAGAVVTKDVPANTVAAGTPARVIRQLGSKEED